MFKGRTTYTEFLRAEEGIATNVLADRLVRLEQDGIVSSERDERTGRSVRYRLTSKGVDLLPVLLDIIEWSATYDLHTAAEPEFVERLRSDRSGLEADLRRDLAQSRSIES